MLELKLSINSNGGSIDGSNGPSLSLPMEETRRCDNNLITYNPINWIFNHQEVIGWVDSVGKHGPGVLFRLTVHGELAFHAADSLISEHGLLSIIVTSIHDEVKRIEMWLLLSSCNELSSNNSDESSLNSDGFFVRKEKSSVADCDSLEDWSVLID